MISKFSRFAVVAFVSAVFVFSSFVYFGGSVFAEGDPALTPNCSGKIMGKNVVSNPNFGQIDFDSHPSPYSDANKVTDLSIVGLAPGLAPADMNLAACVDVSVPFVDKTYMFRGYAWNTNLGFFSFFCNGTLGQMGKNQGVDCGNYTYGVGVGVADGAGKRLLSGNAWNPAFGYIQLAGSGLPTQESVGPNVLSGANGLQPWPSTDVTVGGVTYTITLQKVIGTTAVIGVDGGFAPVDEGSTYDFGGGVSVEVTQTMVKPGGGVAVFNVKKQIPSVAYQVSADKDGKLSGWAWTEAKVWVNMAGITIQIPGQKVVTVVGAGVCDGRPFSCIEVVTDPEKGLDKVLSGSNGSGGIKIGSDPEVKVANGVDDYKIHLYLREADGVTPMNVANYNIGPITFSWKDTLKLQQGFSNNTVLAPLDGEANPLTKGGAVLAKPIVANFPGDFDALGGGDYRLKTTIKSYAPTTEMNVSYTTSMKPNVAFKNEVFFASMKSAGNKIPVVKEPNRLKLSNINVPLTIKATGLSPALADGRPYNKVIYPNGKDGLFFQFRPAVEVNTLYTGNNQDSITGFRSIPFSFKVGGVKDLNLNATANVNFLLDYDETLTKYKCALNGESVVGSSGFAVNFTNGGNSHPWSDVGTSQYNFDLQAVASLPDYDSLIDKAAISKPCMQAQGPSLYSQVAYNVGGNSVTYFSNHIPRTVTSITNPAAVVHGNLYAAKAFSPSASVETQETGSKSVNIVRDGIYENITSKISGVTLDKYPNPTNQNSEKCVFGNNGGCSVTPVVVDGSEITVVKNKDVTINVTSYKDNQTLIVMNGNIFIDSDIYKAAPSTDKMQIIALRPYSSGCNKGNIYIKNTVKNINANVFTDCSIFSYVDAAKIDPSTGIYGWTDFSEMVDSLSNQLRWFGSIASHNTVGGSDLDKDSKNPKKYLLDGFKAWDTNGLTSLQKLAIQAYDLNYLRLFKLSIQTNELGMPIDQSCKKALTLDEMLQISEFNAGQAADTVYGVDGTPCDGIDALSPYDSASNSGGDLVAPVDNATLAQGLDAGSYDPVYVIFSASTSPLFKK